MRMWMRVAAVTALGAVAGATAQTEGDAASGRIADLERKLDALSREVESLKLSDGIVEPTVGLHGMAPGASKVYFQQHGVSIGGYGEGLYQHYTEGDKTDEWDFLRAILYVGYKFNDKLVLNTELEVEHAADDKEGEVAMEFAYLDYLYRPELNFRGGLVLAPVGLVNELHEPTTFRGAKRPLVETRIIPTTWRENGAGIFGDVGGFSYKAYLMNGFDASDFSASGLRDARQKGSKAKADDLASVLRIDYTAIPGFLVGGSVYYGDSGQDLDVDATTLMYEGHVDWTWRGLNLRALAVAVEVDDVAELNALLAEAADKDLADFNSVGERMVGWYVQAGFDVLSVLRPGEAALIPFVRYEELNTQDEVPSGFSASGANDIQLTSVGVDFKPIDQVVLKTEYQFYDDEANSLPNQWNVSMGYVF